MKLRNDEKPKELQGQDVPDDARNVQIRSKDVGSEGREEAVER